MRKTHSGKVLWVFVLGGVCAVLSMTPTEIWALKCWTTVGSAGTVDEYHVGIFQKDGTAVGFKPTYDSGELVLYYNVVDEEGLHGGVPPNLTIRYRDNGTNALVQVKLIRVNVLNGLQTTLINFSSNSYPASAAFQTRLIPVASLPSFDFVNNAYYFRVRLSRTSVNGIAGLSLLRLCK